MWRVIINFPGLPPTTRKFENRVLARAELSRLTRQYGPGEIQELPSKAFVFYVPFNLPGDDISKIRQDVFTGV